jgi:hypothetical protein
MLGALFVPTARIIVIIPSAALLVIIINTMFITFDLAVELTNSKVEANGK